MTRRLEAIDRLRRLQMAGALQGRSRQFEELLALQRVRPPEDVDDHDTDEQTSADAGQRRGTLGLQRAVSDIHVQTSSGESWQRALALSVAQTPVTEALPWRLARVMHDQTAALARIDAMRAEPWRLIGRIADPQVDQAEYDLAFDGVALRVTLRTPLAETQALLQAEVPRLANALASLSVACAAPRVELAALVSACER